MPVAAVCLTRSRNAAGDLVVRLGIRLLDEYLQFLAGRCRPNTVLAVAYDLKVFFTMVAKPPRRVRPVDVLAFMTAQRAGGEGRLQVAGKGEGGVSARTPRQSRPPLRSSKRLPETSVSLPGITLSDKGGQGERAHCRRSERGPEPDGLTYAARRSG